MPLLLYAGILGKTEPVSYHGWSWLAYNQAHKIYTGHEIISTDGFRDTVCYHSCSVGHASWKCPNGSSAAEEICDSSVIRV